MTTVNRTTLKTYFQTGNQPTQTQFDNLIDSNLNILESSSHNINFNSSSLGIGYTSGTGKSGYDSSVIKSSSVDAAAVTISGRRFMIQNVLQVALKGSSSVEVIVTNNEVDEMDIVMGTLYGHSQATTTSIIKSCSLSCYTTGSGKFVYKITNDYNAPILDNSEYSASFVVIK
jgi:hypothetical protein|tara:strand:- start:375 stop:893 length:519 start_codon:yes stop_codon:yes gene_type:complete